MDYHVYICTKKERLLALGVYLGLDGLISLLFYRSWLAFLLFLPGFYWFYRDRKRAYSHQRKERLRREFMTGIQAVSTGLAAGYSVENAFVQALEELKKVYPEQAVSVLEFTGLAQGLAMNRQLEGLLLDLAERSGVEEIESFAQIFAAAKRSGGDLNAIIRNTISITRQKEEVAREIQVCISGKRMEQNVMSMVPFGILLYVGLASPGFLEGMYHNALGVAVMSVCLVIYAAAWLLGRRIVKIEV